MKIDVLVAEIGSTTTVVNAFDQLETDNPVFLAQGQAPTSVKEGDVNIGLQAAIEDMKKNLHIENEDIKKTYSDQDIVKLLENDGIKIARRTVSKYRIDLGYKSSSERKKY